MTALWVGGVKVLDYVNFSRAKIAYFWYLTKFLLC